MTDNKDSSTTTDSEFSKKAAAHLEPILNYLDTGDIIVDKQKIIYGRYKNYSRKNLESYFKKLSKKNIEKNIQSFLIHPNIFNLLKKARLNLWNKQITLKLFPNYLIIIKVVELS